jgi:hypothetical protein
MSQLHSGNAHFRDHQPGEAAARALWRFDHQTEALRLKRRTAAISWDKTINPAGIIQNPSTGRKPNKPNTMRSEPMAMRASLFPGRRMRREPNLISAMVDFSNA